MFRRFEVGTNTLKCILVPGAVLVPDSTPRGKNKPWQGIQVGEDRVAGLVASVWKAKSVDTPAVLVYTGALVKFGPFWGRTTRETGATTFAAKPSPLLAVTARVLVPTALSRGAPTNTPLLLVRPMVEREEVTPPFETTTGNVVGLLLARRESPGIQSHKSRRLVSIICSGGPIGAKRRRPSVACPKSTPNPSFSAVLVSLVPSPPERNIRPRTLLDGKNALVSALVEVDRARKIPISVAEAGLVWLKIKM